MVAHMRRDALDLKSRAKLPRTCDRAEPSNSDYLCSNADDDITDSLYQQKISIALITALI